MKALTEDQKKTQKSAIGFFLNLGSAVVFIGWSGMDSWEDWMWLSFAVVCMVGCVYYVQADIKKAIKGDSDAS